MSKPERNRGSRGYKKMGKEKIKEWNIEKNEGK
jgi:hypothetical protein